MKPVFLPLLIVIAFLVSSFSGMGPAEKNTKDSPMPEIKKENGKYTFYVDGKPFLVLGAQLWNSSAWSDVLPGIWPQLKEMNCNTIEAPIYWQDIEPEPGVFNFKELDALVYGARENGLRLILLWFGSYKNGSLEYTPDWVRENPDKFPRMRNSSNQPVYVLSAISRTNLDADKNAFVKVMQHVREIDKEHKTVIMVQPENEPGSLQTDRDYSDEANKLFFDLVPVELTKGLDKEPGTWQEVFGIEAAEAFNAFYIAKYIDEIAKAGKKVYPLPMYINVWIKENYFQRPGEYPSGGPTTNMIDVWKIAAPELFTIAVDIYHQNYMDFRYLCEKYKRPDNPLFIPEMGNGINFARYQFYALGDYDAMGIAPYGTDPFHIDPGVKRDKEKLDNVFSGIAANYMLFSKASDKILELQGTGNLKAAVEEHGLPEKLLSFENYDVLFQFGYPRFKKPGNVTGRVLIGQLAEDEFLVLGFDSKFIFRPKYGSEYSTAEFVRAEEGYYKDGKWQLTRLWNGDALYHSVLPPEGAILKIKLRRVATEKLMEVAPNFEK